MSEQLKPTTNEEIVSYGIGRQMGDQLKSNRIEGLNIELVKTGLADAFQGVAAPVSEAELQAAFQDLQEKMQARAAEEAKAAGAEGIKYLEENAKKEGVQITESGLQYEILVAGDGDKPTASSTVRTHYHGTFIDGSIFDSSVDRGQPAEFPVNGVIAGWTEALQMMNVGSKWRLHVPSELAYGSQGAQGAIPPHSTLVFEVELLDIL
ncbi:FKBP-type peptidyl-prolyl cis-trans isomerase [Motiliproteus sp. MSK22-1]|uniref:FKBP-type peptidyl-prolyl cis-trans isomerase n=1 Tax=Motiliproteus sp. MSK22-1 TaxID=1897630 RepID=UPI000975F3D0|nr:FKBP-type peptidyl-prolyl cis-trans isomerase [Motiliproteus sp. MSK22-1]OMH33961.1 peptidylprolyl isomerase [Motiliproteus sp. MSK22-1]